MNFRKTVQCLTEKIREADELESVDVDKSFQDVMKRVGREKKVPTDVIFIGGLCR